MAVEQPAIAAFIARLPRPEINLAAYGGVVFPIALVIEAPIIMLLAASTELSRDRASYLALRRFTHRCGAGLTALHLTVAVTPLFDLIVRGLLGVPDEVAEQARLGLLLLTPWTWAIAARRQGQGVLIRYGRSTTVSVGTALRLVATASVLGVGLVWPGLPGVAVGASALSCGVLVEALFVAAVVRRVVGVHLAEDDPERTPLRGRAFLRFYVPMAMMPIVALVIQPIGTAAVARMPQVIASLAVWPVLSALLFLLQSLGLAYNEVVVAMVGRPGARKALWRFTWILTVVVTVGLLLISLTPLSALWFGDVTGLTPELTSMAVAALVIGLPIPGTRVLQSWYQGLLVSARRTAGITEAVLVFGLVCAGTLLVGVLLGDVAGVYMAVIAFALGRVTQTLWLVYRARRIRPHEPAAADRRNDHP